ncbi:hypothetical protein H6G89_10075 [Oscillatoria sp. FACHB-1407]|uniref:hypothetical protein n=1 Tax=Oscillatoria sp. FACHB-1407 TaxID=2692847 RepID=UPI0016872BB1|nr:hypothetical protein [Oscillatoria sp. FACHB-1407]MBD2461394.1 hypothetical protein [Oscillatoria sp. FACHB-1407]
MNHRLSITITSIIGTVLTTSTLLGYNSVSAQETMTPEAIYVGLWQGVDEVDGGFSVRSILPTDSGFRMVGRDTWHGPCGYGDPATVLSQLTVEEGVLEGTWDLNCQIGETAESGDRSFKVRYTFDPETQTLTETLLNPTTEQPIDRIPIVFFRVAP